MYNMIMLSRDVPRIIGRIVQLIFLSCAQKDSKDTQLTHQVPLADPLEMNPTTMDKAMGPT